MIYIYKNYLVKNIKNVRIMRLVGVCKTTHTTHDTEDIVVSCIDTDLGTCGSLWVVCICWLHVDLTCGFKSELKLKDSVINSTHVACTRWLVLFWFECERVNIDTSGWYVGVVLVC